jgi:hypothetical protein
LDLFQKQHIRNTLVGVSLSSIGLVTFWGAHIYGKNALLRHAQQEALTAEGVAGDASKADKDAAWSKHQTEIKRAEMLSMTLNTIGGGLGLVLFGTISSFLGRRGAFVLYHTVAFVMVLFLFQVLLARGAGVLWLALTLPVFGFFTLGMHAGYAVYFPELYPTRLRGTGAGFCFNMGRLATAAAFLIFGTMAISAESKALVLAPLYLVGVIVVLFAKETRDQDLQD